MTGAYVTRTREGSITVTAGAQHEIVRQAVERVGARLHRARRGLDIELAEGGARVGLELTARMGIVLPELACRIQESVAEALREMCGVEVNAVDVSIEELET